MTRAGTGETIPLRRGEQHSGKPSPLATPPEAVARSGRPDTPQTTVHPAEAAYPVKKQPLRQDQLSRGGLSEEQFRSQLIKDDMRETVGEET